MEKVIRTRSKSEGIYNIHHHPSTIYGISVPLDIIHHFLGHPNLDKVNMLFPKLSHLKSLDCESCQLGKHVRAPFPSNSNKRSMSPFDIVHYDV